MSFDTCNDKGVVVRSVECTEYGWTILHRQIIVGSKGEVMQISFMCTYLYEERASFRRSKWFADTLTKNYLVEKWDSVYYL